MIEVSVRIPEPWEFYESYCAEREARRAAALAEGRCSDCKNYRPAPRGYEIGWCPICEEFVDADDPVEECEDDFKPIW